MDGQNANRKSSAGAKPRHAHAGAGGSANGTTKGDLEDGWYQRCVICVWRAESTVPLVTQLCKVVDTLL